MKRLVYLALVAAAWLPVSGCKPSVTYKYKIAVVPKGMTHQFWQSIHRGAERAAADLKAAGIHVQILWEGPRRESDSAEQNAIVQQLVISRGANGLVLAPQHSKAMIPVVKQVVDKGVPVVIIDSGLDDPELFVKYVATDNYRGGRLAAEHLLTTLDKQGKAAPRVMLFPYQPGSESTEQREKGFLDRVAAENKDRQARGRPAVELIQHELWAGATVDTAQTAAQSLLNRAEKEKVDGIFAVNESATTGLLNAMGSRGLKQKIQVMGFDTSDPLLEAVESGDVIGLIAQDPYKMGYLGVWLLVRHLEGDDVKAGSPSLSTGEYVITRANLRDTATRERFDPELQARRTIAVPELKKK